MLGFLSLPPRSFFSSIATFASTPRIDTHLNPHHKTHHSSSFGEYNTEMCGMGRKRKDPSSGGACRGSQTASL
jgi:hypothetical protein